MATVTTNYHQLYGSGHQNSDIYFPGLKSRTTHPPEALGENPLLCFLLFSGATIFSFLSTWPLPPSPSSKPALKASCFHPDTGFFCS